MSDVTSEPLFELVFINKLAPTQPLSMLFADKKLADKAYSLIFDALPEGHQVICQKRRRTPTTEQELLDIVFNLIANFQTHEPQT